MSEFCDGVLYFQRALGVTTYLEHFVPQSIQILSDDQFQYISMNAFPSKQPSNNLIFAFTLDHRLCYCWLFAYNSTIHSIVIISEKRCPYYYICYLNAFRTFIENSEADIDPYKRIEFIWNDLKQWKLLSEDQFQIKLPETSKIIDIDDNFDCFSEFTIYPYIPDFDPLMFWKALVTNRGICVTSADPEELTKAAFGLLNMIAPLMYQDPFLICVNSDDPRLHNLSDYKVAVYLTSNHMHPDETRLRIKVTIPFGQVIDDARRQVVVRQTQDLIYTTLVVLSNTLLLNPFSDLLDFPIADNSGLAAYFGQGRMKHGFKFDDFLKFISTDTFRSYRRKMTLRKYLRNAILSSDPPTVIKSMTRDQLQGIVDNADILFNHFQNDSHPRSVIATYIKLAQKALPSTESSQ